jgi:hypothetical protein
MAQVRALEEHRIGHRLLVAIEAVSMLRSIWV